MNRLFNREERAKEPKEEVEERSDISQHMTSDVLINDRGNIVDENNVWEIPGVVQAFEIFRDEIIKRNIVLKQHDKKGNCISLDSDIRAEKWNYNPNDFVVANEFTEEYLKDIFLWGKGYVEIEKNSEDEFKAYHNIPYKNIRSKEVYRDSRGYITDIEYHITLPLHSDGKEINHGTSANRVILSENMIEIIHGKGILNTGKSILSASLNIDEISNKMISESSLPSGVLETDGRLNKPLVENLKRRWDEFYSGVKNAGKVVILEEGIKYKPIPLSALDVDLTNQQISRKHDIELITGLPFGALTEQRTEVMNKEIRKKVNGYCIAIRSALNNKLLEIDEEKVGKVFEHSFEETTETSMEENLILAKLGKEAEVLTIDERRKIMGKESVEGGKVILLSIGQATQDIESGEITNINTQDVAQGKSKEDIV